MRDEALEVLMLIKMVFVIEKTPRVRVGVMIRDGLSIRRRIARGSRPPQSDTGTVNIYARVTRTRDVAVPWRLGLIRGQFNLRQPFDDEAQATGCVPAPPFLPLMTPTWPAYASSHWLANPISFQRLPHLPPEQLQDQGEDHR